jgi:tripartite-type tricarboxylate transporter receptor subunit TctC
MIVGFGPGGGYDRNGRLMAKYLPKYIPGKPTIVVENKEGAASIVAANYLYNVPKPDGLTFGVVIKGLPYAQMRKVEGVKFDLRKFTWLGSTATEATVLALRTDLPYKTANDLLKAKSTINVGGTGPAEISYQFCVFLKEFLGVDLKLITYPSSPDVMLAVERKEVDGRAGSYSSLIPFIDRGLVKPIIRGSAVEPGLENVASAEDMMTDKKGKIFMGLLAGTDRIGRPYVAPPGVPADIAGILRDAFAKVAKDPELKAETEKMNLSINYIPSDECLKEINFILNQPEDIINDFIKYVK